MKFYIELASAINGRPCPAGGAVETRFPTLPDYKTAWEIEVSSLEELLGLIKKANTDASWWKEDHPNYSPAIILEYNREASYYKAEGWTIILYDSYIE